MLLLDVSNIMYTGASSGHSYFGEATEFKLRSIPYFFQQISSYYGEDTQMIAVFEKVGRMPALAKVGGYKSGRNRNPLVEWEITALQKLLESIGFPILYVEGQEADHVINNYCRLNHDKENISILSADRDLSANVRSGEFTTKMLSYSTVSYNIDKGNFKEITGVDYNFMNINKLLLGCKSDRIKPFPQGREIYSAFMVSLQSLWKRKHKFKIGEHTTADFADEVLMQYTSYEYFIDWYQNSRFFETPGLRELGNRRTLIEGTIFDLPKTYGIDWIAYNNLISVLNLDKTASIKSLKSGVYNIESYTNVISILRQAQNNSTSMFEGNMEELEEMVEVGDVNNILGILNAGGSL